VRACPRTPLRWAACCWPAWRTRLLDDWLRRQKLAPRTAWTLTDRNALLEEIGRVRRRGYALVEQELEPGLCSVAVPLRSADRRAVAALNVGMPWRKGIRSEIETRVLPPLRDCALGIEQVMRQARIR
jgi:IclR family pca regulon transcriptional regulator